MAGALAARTGAPETLAAGGAICILGALWFARQLPEIRRLVRPIYAEMGIVPEVASGLQSASALKTPPEN